MSDTIYDDRHRPNYSFEHATFSCKYCGLYFSNDHDRDKHQATCKNQIIGNQEQKKR